MVRFQMFSRYINTDEDIPICTCIVYCLVVRLYPFFSFLMLFDYFWCVPSFSLGWKIGGEPFFSSYFFFYPFDSLFLYFVVFVRLSEHFLTTFGILILCFFFYLAANKYKRCCCASGAFDLNITVTRHGAARIW